MWIVKKGEKGEKLKGIRKLTDPEKELINKVHFNHRSSKTEKKLATGLIGTIRDKSYWLECDCKTFKKPLLAPVRKRNGTITLKRMTTRYPHDGKCPFKEIEYNENEQVERVGKSAINNDKPLNLHMMYKDQADNEHKELILSGSQTRMPTLARLLYTWMDKTKLNEIKLPITDISNQYKLLEDATRGYRLAKGIPVMRYFSTFPRNVTQMAISLKESIKEWPALVRPHGLFVVAANGYEGEKLLCGSNGSHQELKLSGLMKLSSGRIGNDPGPLIAIFTVTNSVLKPNYFEPRNAFIRPIFSKKLLFPIDSRYERQVLEEILQWLPWWQSKGISVVIKKPLFSLMAEAQVLPDFVFEANGKRVILEVMGSEEENYTDRKARVLPLMEKIGKVFRFDAIGADTKGKFEYELKYTLKGISKELLS